MITFEMGWQEIEEALFKYLKDKHGLPDNFGIEVH